MTKLEAIEARIRVQPGRGWPAWVYHADDDRVWLMARVKELAGLLRQCSSVKRADEIRAALAALDEEAPPAGEDEEEKS